MTLTKRDRHAPSKIVDNFSFRRVHWITAIQQVLFENIFNKNESIISPIHKQVEIFHAKRTKPEKFPLFVNSCYQGTSSEHLMASIQRGFSRINLFIKEASLSSKKIQDISRKKMVLNIPDFFLEFKLDFRQYFTWKIISMNTPVNHNRVLNMSKYSAIKV